MKTFARTTRTLAFLHNAARDAGPQLRDNDWLLLAALTPPILAAFALTEIGTWAISELGRQIRIREQRPASPSLRGIPTPKEIADDWARRPRTLEICLRLGSRLADLDPTLDHTLLRKPDPHGRLVIRARKGGLKGWLADRRVPVAYSTIMRYKKLAQRLRQVLALDERLPLEWLLGEPSDSQVLPASLRPQWQAARRRLADLLRDNPTLNALSRAAEKALGIVRLVTVRNTACRQSGSTAIKRKSDDFSIISRNCRANLDPDRFEATKSAMGTLLGARDLSGPALRLQNRIKSWLSHLAGN